MGSHVKVIFCFPVESEKSWSHLLLAYHCSTAMRNQKSCYTICILDMPYPFLLVCIPNFQQTSKFVSKDYNEDKSRFVVYDSVHTSYKSKYRQLLYRIFLFYISLSHSLFLFCLLPTASLLLVAFPYPILPNVKKRISLISHASVNYFPCLRVFRLVFPFVH